MKRFYLFSLLTLCLWATRAHGDTITINNLRYVGTPDRTAMLVDGKAATGDVVIPSRIGNRSVRIPVTAIADEAFKNNKAITSVDMPSTLRSIGTQAFALCSNLKEVTCSSDSITHIGERAFYGTYWVAGIRYENFQRYWNGWILDGYPYMNVGTIHIKEGTRGIAYRPMLADTVYLPKSFFGITGGAIRAKFIVVDKDNPYLHSDKYGSVYANNRAEYYNTTKNLKITGKGLMQVATNAQGTCVVEDGVQYISKGACEYAGFDSIIVPEGCRVINDRNVYQFEQCQYAELPSTIEFLDMWCPRGMGLKMVLKAKTVPENNGESDVLSACSFTTLYVPAVAWKTYDASEYHGKFRSLEYYSNEGDVNDDGIVNSADVVAIYNHIASGEDSGVDLPCADVNCDKTANSADVVATYNYIIGTAAPSAQK